MIVGLRFQIRISYLVSFSEAFNPESSNCAQDDLKFVKIVMQDLK